jgi:hypothetical protein
MGTLSAFSAGFAASERSRRSDDCLTAGLWFNGATGVSRQLNTLVFELRLPRLCRRSQGCDTMRSASKA